MHYRTTTPSDNGFESEHEEHEGIRDAIQTMMERSGPGELLDSVLIIVNICETRALLRQGQTKEWYERTALFLRSALDTLAHADAPVCPQEKLENPAFYFPQTGTTC